MKYNFLNIILSVCGAFLVLIIYSITKRKKEIPTKEHVEVPKNQANLVLAHIEMYGSICKTEAQELYGIKNLKAVVHVIRTKHKIEIESISQRGGDEFRGYAFKK